eukprot:10283445-Alexandrium_andersonii.AAC.1
MSSGPAAPVRAQCLLCQNVYARVYGSATATAAASRSSCFLCTDSRRLASPAKQCSRASAAASGPAQPRMPGGALALRCRAAACARLS